MTLSGRATVTRLVTVALPADLLDHARREVEEGRGESRNSLIAGALEAELRRRDTGAIDRDIRGMSSDEEHRRESRLLMWEFESADRETWAIVDE